MCTYIDTVRVFGVDHDRTNFTLLRKAAIRNVLPILAAGLQSEKAEAVDEDVAVDVESKEASSSRLAIRRQKTKQLAEISRAEADTADWL